MVLALNPTNRGPAPKIAVSGPWASKIDPICGGPGELSAGLGTRSASLVRTFTRGLTSNARV